MKKQDVVRNLIIEKTLNLFHTKDYDEISVSDICTAAGISRTSFYSLFSCKLDVILAIEKDRANFSNLDSSEMLLLENDFERAMYILRKHGMLCHSDNIRYCKTLLTLQLNKDPGIFELANSYNTWYEKLIENCQRSGIVRNKMPAIKLVRYAVQLAFYESFNWCRTGGNYDLLEAMRAMCEEFYDVAPEYRKCT